MTRMQILFGFSGRISRSQFWLGVLGLTAYSILICALFAGLMGALNNLIIAGVVFGIAMLVLCWSGLSLYAKRLHDHDKSLWWVLMGLIPIVGQIWLIVQLGFIPGTPQANNYGEPQIKDQGQVSIIGLEEKTDELNRIES